ncbi:MAG TPA: type II toxin-antitoxin system antitoxin SocA domain-containing protein [Candidatus Saccharimonadales bacterium]|nr:type II toxin-antitoxin system antitoxin SocA domain-containing protein [Candidatus Saccharimonadales bacterium]
MLGNKILGLREKAGLTQTAVAEKLGVTRAAYIGWETGKREPSLAQLKKIAELYELSPADLLNPDLAPTEEANRYDFSSGSDEIEPREIVKESPDKLREVLLYMLDKVGAKPNVGETVIYKLLYFIDFDYYEKYGKSITGLTYVRNHYGPTPQARTFTGVVNAMKHAHELEVVETSYFNHLQKKYLPVTKPALEHLSGQELRHVDEVLARLGDKSATELSDLSHKDTPWIVTKNNQPIDYQFVMYRTPVTSVKEPEDEL